MSLSEETCSNYDEYKARVAALEEAGPSSKRVVFLFEQAEGNGPLNSALAGVKKKGTKEATLIHVKITKAEFNSADCPYKTDAKFKVTVLPFISVFNQKTTLGRNMILRKLEADKVYDEKKLGNMFD